MKKIFVFLGVLLGFTASISNALDFTFRIAQAQQMLEQYDMIAGCEVDHHECLTRNGIKHANTILAIFCGNSNESSISLVRLDYNSTSSGGYEFKRYAGNGVNTRFSVKSPEGCSVLAVRRAVYGQGFDSREVVYTPYSPEIDSEEMRWNGMDYLSNLVSQARFSLNKKGVMSYAFPGQSVAQTVPTWVAVHLAIVEHIDPKRAGHELIGGLINEVLVTIAANKSNAYRYSVSKANARGLFQFTQGTYADIYLKYGLAELAKDFVIGTSDHLNSAKAALLLFDNDMGKLPVSQKKAIMQNSICHMEYLAASYNGGPGNAWNAIGTNCTIAINLLLPETQGYILNLRRVHRKLNLNNPFS